MCSNPETNRKLVRELVSRKLGRGLIFNIFRESRFQMCKVKQK